VILTLDDSKAINANQTGGKAANIARMRGMGLPTPDGFVSTVGETFESRDRNSPFAYALNTHIRNLAQRTGKTWGLDYGNPLIVSVRSGAPISMPGMMDTILNVGLNRGNLDRFVESRKATREFGLDCYRRLIHMFGTTVKGIDPELFNEVYEAAQVYYDILDEEAYETLVNIYEDIYLKEVGETFPSSPSEQLYQAADAVYASWWSEKALAYRSLENISDSLGTAVTVQEMIFGNLDASATGVVFTHNPNTGVKGLYGDFLKKAQGEDVVSGTHKVNSIDAIFEDPEIEKAARDLQATMARLFHVERDILDVEFTIERGKLYLLQYRIAKRSKRAGVRLIVDLSKDGDITSEEATNRFMDLLPQQAVGKVDDKELTYKGKGLGVTDGLAIGKIATNHDRAQLYIDSGEDYVYVSKETSPSDSVYMKNAVGILTAKGGRLSHAAVVARGWDKPCVVCFEKMKVNSDGIMIDNEVIDSGSLVKINGATGEVWL
jgi:pyruvate,orthophosphate dikinase